MPYLYSPTAIAIAGGGRPLIRIPVGHLTIVGSDDFNRADGALASPWRAFSNGAMTLISNEAKAVNNSYPKGNGNYRYSEVGYTSDQFSQCTIGTVTNGTDDYIGVSVRNQSPSQTNYSVIYQNGILSLQARITTNPTQLDSRTIALTTGDAIRLIAEGNPPVLTVQTNGTTLFTYTDYVFQLVGGQPGIVSNTSTNLVTLDNWVGGNKSTIWTS